MIKRVLSLMLILCISLTVVPIQSIAQAASVPQVSATQKAVERMAKSGIISQKNKDTHVKSPVTRAQVATIYDKLMGYQVQSADTFSDLSSSDEYYEVMLKAHAAQIFDDDNGKINPKGKVTRQDFFVTLANAIGLKDESKGKNFTDVADIDKKALPRINALSKAKIIKGINNGNLTYRLEPKKDVTYGEVITLIDSVFPLIINKAGKYNSTTAIKGSSIVNKPSVTLSKMKIDNNLIIAEGVGEGEVTLDNVTVKGDTIIRGGGEKSVDFKGKTKYNNINVNKNKASKPVTLNFKDTVKAKSVTLQKDCAKANIKVDKGVSIDKIDVYSKGTTITGTGKVKLVNVTGNDTKITLPNAKIVIDPSVFRTTIGGKVVAGGAIITTDKNGKIATNQVVVKPDEGDSGVVMPKPTPVTIEFDTKGNGTIESITVNAGTTIPTLPTISKENSTFLGWFLEDTLVDSKFVVRKDITLTAEFEENTSNELQEVDTKFSLTDREPSYLFYVTADGKDAQQVKSALTLEDLSDSGVTELEVTDSGNSKFIISAKGGFVAGGMYRLTLAEGVNFDDEDPLVRSCDFNIKRAESSEIQFSNSLEFVDVDAVVDATQGGESTPKLRVSPFTMEQGDEGIAKNTQTGTFKLKDGANPLAMGQIVCISETNPKTSSATNDIYNDATSYIKITEYNEDTKIYTYVAAEAEEILLVPDVLPIPSVADTDNDPENNSITVLKTDLDYSDTKYEQLKLNAGTTADKDDFITFYTGEFGSNVTEGECGRITSVEEQDEYYVIKYTPVTMEEMSEVLNYHQIEDIDPEELLKNTDVGQLQKDLEKQAIDSGFAEKAAELLAQTVVNTDSFDNIIEGFDPDIVKVTTQDGKKMSLSQIRATGRAAELNIGDFTVKVSLSTKTKHFNAGTGVVCSVEIGFNLKLNENFSVRLKATFEEEIRMSVSASGDIIWGKVWIFPYIKDYKFSANIDIYNYTYIHVNAVLASGDSESVDISEVMEKILNMNDEKEQRSGISKLHELYADMMNEKSDWIDIFRTQILQINIQVLRGIIQVEIKVEFVIKADIKVSIGMEFEYKSGDRYNFWIKIFSATAGSDSTRLVNQETKFNFYVMGSIGVRAGIEVSIAVGLFSVDWASIGLIADIGAQVRLNGFFLYEYANMNNVTTKNKSSGALYLNIGLYIEIYFKAQAGEGKYSYQPLLYSAEWPLYSAGSQFNVYDFTELKEPLDEIKLKNDNKTFVLPIDLLSMQYLDLASGDSTEKMYPQDSFDISFTHPAFTFNGTSVVVKPGLDRTLDANMVIRYKNASLSFTSLPITRVIRLHWDNLRDSGYNINFNSNGGSYVPTILKPYNTAVTQPADPVKIGYTFGGWYTDKDCTNKYIFDKMAANDITIEAKWIKNTDTKYVVQHWKETLISGVYELAQSDIENKTGTTEDKITPATKQYEGFTAPATQTTVIAGDGSTIVRYEYTRNSYMLFFRNVSSRDVVYELKYGEDIIKSDKETLVPNMVREGHTFTGWDKEIAKKMPANYLDYKSQWRKNSYSVEFWLDGVKQIQQKQTYDFGATLKLFTPENIDEFDKFSGWYVDSSYLTKYTGVTMPSKNIVLYGNVVDNATTYTVEYYRENLEEGEYILNTTEKYAASKGAKIQASLIDDPGFAKPEPQTVTIADDGSTVVKYYYTRNSYTITFIRDEENLIGDALPEPVTLKYGASLYDVVPIIKPGMGNIPSGVDGILNWRTDEEKWFTSFYNGVMPSKDVNAYFFCSDSHVLVHVFCYIESPSEHGKFTLLHDELTPKLNIENGHSPHPEGYSSGRRPSELPFTPDYGEHLLFFFKDVTVTFSAEDPQGLWDERSDPDGQIAGKQATGHYGSPFEIAKALIGISYNNVDEVHNYVNSKINVEGYWLSHWYDKDDPEKKDFGYKIPSKDATLVAAFIPRKDTKYKVNHWIKKADGSYTEHSTQNLEGVTAENTSATALNELLEQDYTLEKPIVQQAIDRYGGTVIDVYYVEAP